MSISFKRIGLIVTAVVLPAAGFLYWTAHYGSSDLRSSVNTGILGAGTLLYFCVIYLLIFMHWLPMWAIALIVVAPLTFEIFLKRDRIHLSGDGTQR